MKNLSLIIFILLFSLTTQAQEYDLSLGLRGGRPGGVTVKKIVGLRTGVEGILGTNYDGDVDLIGLYEFHGYLGRNTLWYAGLGAGIRIDKGLGFSVDAAGGIEYDFLNIPINASIDWKPAFYFREKKMLFAEFAVSIRYVLIY